MYSQDTSVFDTPVSDLIDQQLKNYKYAPVPEKDIEFAENISDELLRQFIEDNSKKEG